MFAPIIRFLYGDLSTDEMKKFGLLSLTFFFVIGTYWLLRPLKDDLFNSVVGLKQWQPLAKILSVVVVFCAVMLYSKLVDIFQKHRLFYIIGLFYTGVFAIITYCIGLEGIGVANTVKGGDRLFGWFAYFAIESFGSIVIALFWSFVASITDSASAKKGFAFVIGGAQFGSILGAYSARYASSYGLQNMFAVGTVGVLCAIAMIWFFMAVMPEDQLVGNKVAAQAEKSKTKKTGFFEGIRLIFQHPYLVGIFAVSTLYEVIATLVDYQMKVLAASLPEYQVPGALSDFLGLFGTATNGLALVLSLLGTSYLMRRFGLTFCLLAYPVLLGFGIIYLFGLTTFMGEQSVRFLLWSTFGVMILAKGLSYALNNPSKEMMYIPTSKDTKFKAKGFTDMFGSRSAKASASFASNWLKGLSVVNLVQIGSIISLGILGVWIMAALFVGRTFNKLTAEDKIIE